MYMNNKKIQSKTSIDSSRNIKNNMLESNKAVHIPGKIKIGYVTGVWDVFHIGHVNMLRNAKSYCDKLICAVTTDELSESFKKKRPAISYNERFEIIKAIRFVDEVVPQDSMDKFEAWKKYRFDMMFASDTPIPGWSEIEQEFLNNFKKGHAPKIIRLPYTQGVSSTDRRKQLKI